MLSEETQQRRTDDVAGIADRDNESNALCPMCGIFACGRECNRKANEVSNPQRITPILPIHRLEANITPAMPRAAVTAPTRITAVRPNLSIAAPATEATNGYGKIRGRATTGRDWLFSRAAARLITATILSSGGSGVRTVREGE